MKIKRHRGFTLIEVMIALSIFAVLAATVSRTASQNADTVLRLEEKTLASFVAENRLNKVKLSGYPSITQTRDTEEMAQREWHITTNVTATQVPDLRQVEVTVARAEEKENPLVSLITLVGNQ